MENTKISSYLNIARKANYLIIGCENLKSYNKKLYMIILSEDAGKTAIEIANKQKELTNCIVVKNVNLPQILGIEKCQIVGIKNKGIVDAIEKSKLGE